MPRTGRSDEQGRIGGRIFARRREGAERPRDGPQQPGHSQHDAVHKPVSQLGRRIRRRRAAAAVPGARLVWQTCRTLALSITFPCV